MEKRNLKGFIDKIDRIMKEKDSDLFDATIFQKFHNEYIKKQEKGMNISHEMKFICGLK